MRKATDSSFHFGSPCLKFCLIAEGEADLYPRLAPTHEWDTPAGHAVLAAAGGDVLTPRREPLRYGKAPQFLHAGFIAVGQVRLDTRRARSPEASEHALAGVGKFDCGIYWPP
jgi:3'-phosphoadenosine 5'-phosphosulfate (PAPS) 3'-phosphatase